MVRELKLNKLKRCWNNKDVKCKHYDRCKGNCGNIPEKER